MKDSDDQNFGDEQRRQLADVVRYWRMPLKDIWLHYFSLGGTVGEYELDAYINSSYSLSALQHDILAQAINELIDAQPAPPRAPYSRQAHLRFGSDDERTEPNVGKNSGAVAEGIDDGSGCYED